MVNTRAILWCKAAYLAASFDTVEEFWGTWETFRRDGLGLDDTRMDAFHDAMLA